MEIKEKEKKFKLWEEQLDEQERALDAEDKLNGPGRNFNTTGEM